MNDSKTHVLFLSLSRIESSPETRIQKKSLDQELETEIQLECCHLLRAEKSSHKFDELIRYKEYLLNFSRSHQSVVSFYDGIMSTITKFDSPDGLLGYVVDRQTDNSHWQLVDIYVPENSPLLNKSILPQDEERLFKVWRACSIDLPG
jgi:hypothetical protein